MRIIAGEWRGRPLKAPLGDTTRPTDNFFYFAGRGRAFTLGWDYRF